MGSMFMDREIGDSGEDGDGGDHNYLRNETHKFYYQHDTIVVRFVLLSHCPADRLAAWSGRIIYVLV